MAPVLSGGRRDPSRTLPFAPRFLLEVDGVDVSETLSKDIQSLECADGWDDEADSLSFELANDPPFSIPRRGAAVRLWLWYEGGEPRFMGSFEVDEATVTLRPATLSVTARSASFSTGTAKERRSAEWERVSLADLAGRIAARHGMAARVSVDAWYDAVAQTEESDLHFLRRLTVEAHGIFAVRDGTILITPPTSGSRPRVSIVRTSVESGQFRMADRGKYRSVRAVWWDAAAARERSVTVSGGDGEATYVLRRPFRHDGEARTAARNMMDRLRRGELSGEIVVPGDPSLAAGAEAELSGFSPRAIDGLYLIEGVRHSLSRRNWTTSVKLERLP